MRKFLAIPVMVGALILAIGRLTVFADEYGSTTNIRALSFQWGGGVVSLDGGSIVVSGSETRGHGTELAAIDSVGDISWAETLVGVGLGGMQADGSGGFFAAGSQDMTSPDLFPDIKQARGATVVHFDSRGKPLWTRVFNAGDYGHLQGVTLPNKDNAVYVVGMNYVPNEPRRPFVAKLDRNGVPLWIKTVDFVEQNLSVALSTDIGGGIYWLIGNNILRLDANGDLIWARTITTDDTQYHAAGIAAVVEGIVVAGTSGRNDRSGLDGLVMSIGVDGNLRWAEHIDIGAADQINMIENSADNGVVLGGFMRRMGPTLEDKTYVSEGWITGLDSGGVVTFSNAIGVQIKGQSFGNGIDSAALHNDAIVAIGRLATSADSMPILVNIALDAPVTGECAQMIPVFPKVTSTNVRLTPFDPGMDEGDISSYFHELTLVPLEVKHELLCGR